MDLQGDQVYHYMKDGLLAFIKTANTRIEAAYKPLEKIFKKTKIKEEFYEQKSVCSISKGSFFKK